MRASEIQSAAVLGAGTMGAGIAQVLAGAGMEVRLQDLNLDLARAGIERVRSMLEKGIAKGKVRIEYPD